MYDEPVYFLLSLIGCHFCCCWYVMIVVVRNRTNHQINTLALTIFFLAIHTIEHSNSRYKIQNSTVILTKWTVLQWFLRVTTIKKRRRKLPLSDTYFWCHTMLTTKLDKHSHQKATKKGEKTPKNRSHSHTIINHPNACNLLSILYCITNNCYVWKKRIDNSM